MGLYSIKMRASKDGNHISGAESILNEECLEEAIKVLVKRAMNHSKGKSDFINIKIEAIDDKEIEYLEPLKVTTVKVKDHIEGMKAVQKILENLGIDENKGNEIISMLKENSDIRGAMVVDIHSLKRLENDKDRGIRATYMDFEQSNLNCKTKNNKAHFIEALALATKVANAPNIIGEICYSDDPDYTAGYIASKKYGYIRFPYLKELGDSKGGRVFLYDSSLDKSTTLNECIKYIEEKKVLIKDEIYFNDDIEYENIDEVF